jgi:acetyltransferase-like isoleucine patch superfamily enzyme
MSIHSSAVVHPSFVPPKDLEVGAFTQIGRNVKIGPRTRIGSYCIIGDVENQCRGDLQINEDSIVRSHSVIYGGSEFGSQLETGHHATLREGIKAGPGLRVGSYSDIQNNVRIGKFVRIHSKVFVAPGTEIDSFVWIFPCAVITNDPHPPNDRILKPVKINEYAVIAAQALLMPGVVVGKDSVVAAGSIVTKNVEDGHLVMGAPARCMGLASQVQLRDNSGPAYPWRSHFDRGFPKSIQWLLKNAPEH